MFSLQHAGRVLGEHPAICSVFGRMQIGISAWRTDNLTNVSWLRFVITDNCWNIIWKDVMTVFFHVTLTNVAVE